MASSIGKFTDRFFQNQALYGRYRWPTLIVLFAGIAWALQPIAIYYALEYEEQRLIQDAVATDWMASFLTPALLWVFFWLSFLFISNYFSRQLRPGRLFKLVGWGFAPFILIGITRAAGFFYIYQGAVIPIPVRQGRVDAEWEGYRAMIAEMAGDPMLIALTVFSWVFLLVSGYMWMYAVKNSTDIPKTKHIILVVSVPLAIYLFVNLYTVAYQPFL